jgi:hypothetical protein
MTTRAKTTFEYLLVEIQELGEPVHELLRGEGGVGLQQHEASTPGVTRLLVDVQLQHTTIVEVLNHKS